MAIQTYYHGEQLFFLEKAALFRLLHEVLFYCFAPCHALHAEHDGRVLRLEPFPRSEKTFWTEH